MSIDKISKALDSNIKSINEFNKALEQAVLKFFGKSETNRQILKSLIADSDSKDFQHYSARLYLCATKKHSQASPMRYRVVELQLADSGFVAIKKADLLSLIATKETEKAGE